MLQEFNSDIHSNSNDEKSHPLYGYFQYLNQPETCYNSKSLDTNQNNNVPSLNDVKNAICNSNFNNIEQMENEAEINNDIYYIKKENKDENIKSENKILVEKEKSIQYNELQDNINNNNNNNNNLNNDNNNNKLNKLGRKKKGSNEIGKHGKKAKDNIANKIKTHFYNNFTRDLIKDNSINKNINLKKLQTKGFTSDVSKKNNEHLFGKKMAEILKEKPISTKYSKSRRDENKKIIDEIYKENKEKNVIKILELTYEELFIIYKIKLKKPEDLKKLEEIKDKIEGLILQEKNNEYQDFEYFIEDLKKKHDPEYIEKVKTIGLDYKNYFINKNERKSK